MPWQPTATLNHLKKRQAVLHSIRRFFLSNNVLEVETPLLSSFAASDVYIESMCVDQVKYLMTSPEYHMKRLLAAHNTAIFQICKAFRKEEFGTRHNSEFSMLEWYQPGWNLNQLMDQVLSLVKGVAGSRPVEQADYFELFNHHLAIDPLTIDFEVFLKLVEHQIGQLPCDLDREGLIDLAFSQIIEPKLNKKNWVFVTGYPAYQAALAKKIEKNGRQVAARFELYGDGLELANGYWELTDAVEQRKRFEQDNLQRKALGLPVMPLDEHLLSALEHGLCECSGVALGLDRLMMVVLAQKEICEVLSFTDENA